MDQACISSITRSVIRETVSLDTDAPYTSAKCALISPVVRPFAYNDSTTASTSVSRRCRFVTITGSNVPSRSRGTSISTWPALSVSTVLVAGAVAGVAAVPALDGVLVVAEVLGHLLLEGGLDHRLGERLEQPVRAGQLLTPGPGCRPAPAPRHAPPPAGVSVFFAAFLKRAHAHQCLGHLHDPSRRTPQRVGPVTPFVGQSRTARP